MPVVKKKKETKEKEKEKEKKPAQKEKDQEKEEARQIIQKFQGDVAYGPRSGITVLERYGRALFYANKFAGKFGALPAPHPLIPTLLKTFPELNVMPQY